MYEAQRVLPRVAAWQSRLRGPPASAHYLCNVRLERQLALYIKHIASNYIKYLLSRFILVIGYCIMAHSTTRIVDDKPASQLLEAYGSSLPWAEPSW